MAEQPAAPAGIYMTTVKLGPKGQIVIPKEVRQFYGVQPGDSFLLLADKDRGVALVPQSHHQKMLSLFSQAFSQVFPAGGSS